jgi:ATP-dependent Clp protease ATP-binding subunit ClpA
VVRDFAKGAIDFVSCRLGDAKHREPQARRRVNVFENYSRAAKIAIMFARVEAGRVGAESIDTEHLLLGAMRTDPVTINAIAPHMTLDVARERAATRHEPAVPMPISVDLPLSDDAKRALEQADALAMTHGSVLVRTEHLLLALITTDSSHAAAILNDVGASADRLSDLVRHLTGFEQQADIEWSKEDLSDLGI